MKVKTMKFLRVAFALAVLAVLLPLVSKNVDAAESTWTVTFHNNGGDEIPSIQVPDGQYGSIPSPTREGYVFASWYTDPELTRYYGGGRVYSDLDLYAKWFVLVPKVEATVTLPKTGDPVDLSVIFSDATHCTSPRSDCVTITEMEDGNFGDEMQEGDVYKAGTKYFVLIWFSPDTGYDYSRAQTTAMINGNQATWWTSIGDGRHTCGWYIFVTTDIELTKQPTNVSATKGATANFSVEAIATVPLSYQWQCQKSTSTRWEDCDFDGADTDTLSVPASTDLNGAKFRCVIAYSNKKTFTSAATLTVRTDQSEYIKSAKAQYPSIAKTSVQDFTVETTADVKNLILYAEGGTTLVKTWAASGNSTVSGNIRTWKVSQAIGTAGDRKLVFKGGTTSTTPVTNAVTVSFKVLNTGVVSASAKNATIKKGGEQTFTVKTTSDAKYLMEYAENGNLVKTWTASSSNSTVSGSVRTWTVSQNIATAGKRTLSFKAGTTSTPTAAQRTATFTVEDVWVNSASVKFATIGKGGTQTFTVKTTSNAQYLMLYGEGGNLVKTWGTSGNSSVSGDVRTWTVSLAIGTAGNRELTLKAGKTTTPSSFGKTVKFAVVEKKLISAKAKLAAIAKGATQTFEVETSADVKNLMLYAEGGNLVKSWAASGNSTETAQKTRKWTVSLTIGTVGDRKLVFKGGTTNTTPVTNALTVSFKVESIEVISVSAKYATMNRGTEQVFTVKTSADAKYLVEYAEDGKTVAKTWTASSSNSTVSGNVRTWTLTQTINTAGNRKLYFKAGSTSTPTSAAKSVSFVVK